MWFEYYYSVVIYRNFRLVQISLNFSSKCPLDIAQKKFHSNVNVNIKSNFATRVQSHRHLMEKDQSIIVMKIKCLWSEYWYNTSRTNSICYYSNYLFKCKISDLNNG